MKISRLFQALLPGIFLFGYNIGTGSVTAMAKAGANYGVSLLWAVVFSCIVTYYLINTYGRYTLVTGETALEAFRRHIHPAVGLFFIAALTVIVMGGIMGVMGIMADVCFEWSKSFTADGINSVIWALGFTTLLYALLWFGRIRFFERILAILVAFMGTAFLLNFFILMPPYQEILAGFLPRIPAATAGSDNSSFLVTASLVGTTVSSIVFLMRTILVKEEGWTENDFRLQKRDARISVILMFVVSFTIMAAAAGTLYPKGLVLNSAADMVLLLKPIAGSAAVTLFVVGLVAAGLSSQLPNILVLPWMLADYTSSEQDMTRPKYRIILLIMASLGLIVPIFQARPVFVMLASQALLALVLPATVACIFFLTTRKSLMKEHVNSRANNILLTMVLIFSLVMSGISLSGLLKDLF